MKRQLSLLFMSLAITSGAYAAQICNGNSGSTLESDLPSCTDIINMIPNPPPPPAPNCNIPQSQNSLLNRISARSKAHTEVAYGCTANSQNQGFQLTKSLVAMYFPRNIDPNTNIPAYWSMSCTGTVIGKRWILTAAHCVANADPQQGDFYGEENTVPLYIAPWQTSFNGIPTRIYESTVTVKFPVKAIYVQKDYNYYGEPWPESLPYFDYLKADWALLELESNLPQDQYQVINLAQSVPSSQSQIWIAGYGTNQNQTVTGALNYRDMYYMTNKANNPDDNFGGTPGNYGEVYTLGTLPEPYAPYSQAAWKFSGNGDSGGPILYYDTSFGRNELSLLGTLTGGIYCSTAGYFAPLPYSYMAHASIPYYSSTITSVMNHDQSAGNTTRCTSPNNGAQCYNW